MRASSSIVLVFTCMQVFAQTQGEHLLAGMSAARAGDLVPAEQALTRAVAEAPDDARTWYHRGVNRLALGDDRGALRDLDRAVTLAPDDVHALLRRADAHEKAGHPGKSRSDLRRVLQHHHTGPAAEEALLRLGSLSLLEGDVRSALDRFDHLVAIAPHHAQALCKRAMVHAAMGRDDDALADLEAAIGIDPSLPEAHAQVGAVLIRMGRRQEACHALHTAHGLGDRSVEELLLRHCDR